ncbi:winged helix-turn-helix domain-containing protein [Nocardioides sambongensis]|uniref:winged helix-turn-helix domain-containing protein n=1 Tax=Nocardioides sambongensis TaxID=2589074 RepID=UPI0015E84F31|nr:crosslink repair DNA glycosylase YcaQ family protein [Nocardioides sambongensis]
MQSLSLAQARRIALAAQGFADAPHAAPTMRTLDRALTRTGVLQVDSVNVLQRAHYMPLYARMGPYAPDLLRRAAQRRPRRLVEYWAHVQALMPVELWPVMRFRMERYREQNYGWWRDVDHRLKEELFAVIADRGGLPASALDDGAPRSRDHWGWNWSAARKALDILYRTGDLAIAGRTSQFEVIYDLPERVIPAEHLAAAPLTAEQAHVELIRRAARSHGVAGVKELADYYRMRVDESAVAVRTLVDSGELQPVEVQGWRRPAYLHADARLPRRIGARTLLSPFDPVVWERSRTEALFDFHYRIEIYVPAPQRVHGYYVLPFLLGDRIVGRVDLKADRATGRLLVPAAFAEPGAPETTPAELAAELRRLAGWLGLSQIVVGARGDLAPALAAEVATQSHTAPVSASAAP